MTQNWAVLRYISNIGIAQWTSGRTSDPVYTKVTNKCLCCPYQYCLSNSKDSLTGPNSAECVLDVNSIPSFFLPGSFLFPTLLFLHCILSQQSPAPIAQHLMAICIYNWNITKVELEEKVEIPEISQSKSETKQGMWRGNSKKNIQSATEH